ncbi:MAG: hypothetical protein KDE27_25500 [Planctomycetes bacterium]|nr:hypothetical protein [Planctomycetota bacterium]
MIRDALVVALVAVVVFQLLRRYVGDYYRVPSGSMQPYLYGDPQRGDVVWVDAWSSSADCRPGDVVVVQHPDDANGQLVKRIAACGDDPGARFIDLREGDIWLGDSRDRLVRVVKDLAAARAMRVSWARWPAGRAAELPLAVGDGAVGDGRLVLPPLALGDEELQQLVAARSVARRRDGSPPPDGFVGTATAVDATYLDACGMRGSEGEGVQVFDAGLELALAAPVDALAGMLETRAETFTFVWRPATGQVRLWRDGEQVAAADLPVRPTAAHRVEFGRLDGRLFFAIDRRPDAELLVERRPEWRVRPERLPRGPRTRLFAAALGDRELELAGLEVFRDVHYLRDPVLGVPGSQPSWPAEVEPGHWFLLGDNALDSRDSRQFRGVPIAAFLGRPRCVLGPWPRTRWLTR